MGEIQIIKVIQWRQGLGTESNGIATRELYLLSTCFRSHSVMVQKLFSGLLSANYMIGKYKNMFRKYSVGPLRTPNW